MNGDLSPAQITAMARISKHGPTTTAELAAAERVRPQAITSIVTTLVERGLVERHADTSDGRRKLLVLTPAGRDRVGGDGAPACSGWSTGCSRAAPNSNAK
ncbi:MarR family winged helix-turn-helix transcriptional regulator [Mycobacterium sp. HNNTM2301]|uniref:MarR family winged helix-turn-helix transcriptional regulator n=1 Tax=Mycobacterium hainanense TaxID=3289775 RepID=UPI0035A6F95A